MHPRTSPALLRLAFTLALLGCDRPAPLALDAAIPGVVTFDGGPPAPPRDGGPGDAGPVGTSPEGVLTNLPHVAFVNRGDGTLAITTANLVTEPFGSGGRASVWWFGDVENRSDDAWCHARIEATFDFTRVDASIDAPPYRVGSSTLSTACIPPRGHASFWGLENDVSPDLLGSLLEVRYFIDATAYRFDTVPHPDAPTVVSVRAAPTDFGDWAAEAELRIGSEHIYNIGLDVYPRDARGLVVGQLTAFHLETAYAFETIAIASLQGVDVAFTESDAYAGFIVGTDTTTLVAAHGPREDDGERRAWEASRARLAAMRAELAR